VPEPQTVADIVSVIERHVDDIHQQVLRSTTDPAKGLPRFKTKARQAQDERVLRVLLKVLVEIRSAGATVERLQAESYARIDGAAIEADDTRLRRRLQGIPEVAPQSLGPAARE